MGKVKAGPIATHDFGMVLAIAGVSVRYKLPPKGGTTTQLPKRLTFSV
jgi:hypothetical protein